MPRILAVIVLLLVTIYSITIFISPDIFSNNQWFTTYEKKSQFF